MARPRQGRKIDFKQWDALPGLISSRSTDGTFLSGFLNFSTPATILRWRGYASCFFDATMQAGDRANFNFGVAVLSTDAVVSGAGNLPDPAGEPEYPWVWWGEFQLNAVVTTAAGVGTNGWGPTAQRIDIDSKAMRKVKPGESLVLLGQMSLQSGSPTVIIDLGQLRVLIGT